MALNKISNKFRVKKRLGHSRKRVEDIGFQAEDHIDRHLMKRLTRLFSVRRFVFGWLSLLILLGVAVTMQLRTLNPYYLQLSPVPGGSFTEGIIGKFTNANPLYATSSVDTAVSKLLFSGLLKYDSNNQLVGDLAQSWTVSEDGKVYKIVLKNNLSWHDNVALNADDVLFTYQTAQNADAKSPLFQGLQGVKVEKIDEYTVTFTLKFSYAPFVHSLTTGIIPKHSLIDTNIQQLRSSPFNNTYPVGSGPFKWNAIELIGNTSDKKEQHIGLDAFKNYHGGAPKLQRFIINAYASQEQLIDAFKNQTVNAIVANGRVDEELIDNSDIVENSFPLSAQNLVFYNTESAILNDPKVRRALTAGINVPEVINGLGYTVRLSDQPILKGQIGYDSEFSQQKHDKELANTLLDEAGWLRINDSSIRQKADKKLEISLYAQNNEDYVYITQELQKRWRALGIEAKVSLSSDNDLQNIINGRGYDALLYGISIGSDPDVFAYWHSTQIDLRSATRLNFSNYNSSVADKSLEAGRSRLDDSLRSIKYKPFLQAWKTDVPAMALYQPRFLYLTHGNLYGLNSSSLNSGIDRYSNVENWMIKLGNTVIE